VRSATRKVWSATLSGEGTELRSQPVRGVVLSFPPRRANSIAAAVAVAVGEVWVGQCDGVEGLACGRWRGVLSSLLSGSVVIVSGDDVDGDERDGLVR